MQLGLQSSTDESRPLLSGLEAIEAFIWVYGVLRLPHEVSLEIEGPREGHGIGRRQRVVETSVVRVRDEALDGLDLVALRRAFVIEVAGRNVIGLDYQSRAIPTATRIAVQRVDRRRDFLPIHVDRAY